MKLNPDCIRDALFNIESVVAPNRPYQFPKDAQELLKKYSLEEAFYHLEQCAYSGFLINFKRYAGPSCTIKDISPQGHKFLANVREDTVWNKTKAIAEKVGSKSLDVLIQISTGVITQIAKNKLGLP